jgi:hypothetical protein
MFTRSMPAAVAVLALGSAAPCLAGSVKPIQNISINLGAVAGDAYYTVEPDGFKVVATFAQRGEDGKPVRFIAVLAPGQHVVFSTPRSVNEPADTVEIIRQNDAVLVQRLPVTN